MKVFQVGLSETGTFALQKRIFRRLLKLARCRFDTSTLSVKSMALVVSRRDTAKIVQRRARKKHASRLTDLVNRKPMYDARLQSAKLSGSARGSES